MFSHVTFDVRNVQKPHFHTAFMYSIHVNLDLRNPLKVVAVLKLSIILHKKFSKSNVKIIWSCLFGTTHSNIFWSDNLAWHHLFVPSKTFTWKIRLFYDLTTLGLKRVKVWWGLRLYVYNLGFHPLPCSALSVWDYDLTFLCDKSSQTDRPCLGIRLLNDGNAVRRHWDS